MKESKRKRALVLVGHGSHLSSSSSAPIYMHAARIRAAGVFDEVLEAFWKEEPSLRDAVQLVESEDVSVVPLFLAEGYFTRQVVPRELGLSGSITHQGERIIRYCPPVGAHPGMAEMILESTRSIVELDDVARKQTALVIVGHGTEQSPMSGDTVHRLVAALRGAGEFEQVEYGFLDERPKISDVVGAVTGRNIVVVPFFVAEGWHTTDTIPAALGLRGPRTVQGDRILWYTQPVGTMPGIPEIILSIVAETDDWTSEDVILSGPTTIRAAREAFFGWIESTPERAFLQVAISHTASSDYALRHLSDIGKSAEQLRRLSSPFDLLALARTTIEGAYRPLRTSSDLQQGWLLEGLDREGIWLATSLLYPAAILHWHTYRTDQIDVGSYESWASRQTGRYAGLRFLDSSDVLNAVETCCGSCLRTRLWSMSDAGIPSPGSSGWGADALVPCYEPCTLFGMKAVPREAAKATKNYLPNGDQQPEFSSQV